MSISKITRIRSSNTTTPPTLATIASSSGLSVKLGGLGSAVGNGVGEFCFVGVFGMTEL